MARRDGGREFFFGTDVISVMMKARGSERDNACSLIRELSYDAENDWLLKERLG